MVTREGNRGELSCRKENHAKKKKEKKGESYIVEKRKKKKNRMVYIIFLLWSRLDLKQNTTRTI